MAKKQTTPAPSDLAARMFALYPSNHRSSGRFDPKNGKMYTEYTALTIPDYERHVTGTMGLGAVPITDDDHCQWAAIDIDNHGEDQDIPIAPIEEKIRLGKLPLIACRSKSGGVHAYLFLAKAQPASKVRTLMTRWASNLGYPGVEIFPKQARLSTTKKEGKEVKQLGNWINLPYLGGDDTVRYAFHNGKKLTLVEYLDLAEKARVTEEQLNALQAADHAQAPPCVQKMFADGVAQGHRNEALYNIVVYLRKMDPEGYETKAFEANNTVFTKPLAKAEAARTIHSAARPDYRYRCNEDPIRSLCDKTACLKRKYGISGDEAALLEAMGGIPVFSDLKKFLTDPVRWEVVIDGKTVSGIATDDLLDWRSMRKVIAEQLTKIVPMIKQQEYERFLTPLMQNAQLVEAPEDASVTGFMRGRLLEFASRTELSANGKNMAERKALLRGLPVVVEVDGERCVVFRQSDLVSFLKRTRTEELKGVNLWMALKPLGVGHTRMRAGDQYAPSINVWYIPIKEVLKAQTKAEAAQFDPGL